MPWRSGWAPYFAVFFLFFVLRDGRNFPGWLSRVASWDAGLADDVATVVQRALRGYFKGIAIIGTTFLISNGTIQSAVSAGALGSALRIHPVVVLLATLIGGTVAGLLGMVLAPPLVAATIQSVAVVKEREAAAHAGTPGPSLT